MHPFQEKESLRAAISERLKRMDDAARQAESRSCCRRVLENLPPGPCTVAVYAALRSEVDLRLLIDECWKRGSTLYFPRHEGGKMAFRKVTSLSELAVGTYGIYEPPQSGLLLDPVILDVAVIPARAYSTDGRRMGRGNGGYDIWIRTQRKAHPSTKFWGVCFDAQILQDIPMEPHDERVDAVMTSRGTFPPMPKQPKSEATS